MKICMVGLGSIGRRHIQNLEEVLTNRGISFQIDALRNTNKELGSVGSRIEKEYFSMEELPEDYDIIFITNPTSLHYKFITGLASKTHHMFIEKPVFDKLDYPLEEIQTYPGGIYYVACPLRHTGLISFAKKLVSSQKVISVRAICSSYLPEWRKGVDYRQVYSARKDMGGGVSLDLIHEWDYLSYLFGLPEDVVRISGHYSSLEIDSEDITLYIARYQDKLVEVHLDYFGRESSRVLELYTNQEKYVLDFGRNVIEKTSAAGREEIFLKKEDFYKNEMEYFIDCIQGKAHNFNSMEEAYRLMKLVCETDGGNYEDFVYYMRQSRLKGIKE